MATRTPKYQLILHDATDQISRTAINENTTKTEAALDGLQQNVSSVQQNLRFSSETIAPGIVAERWGRAVIIRAMSSNTYPLDANTFTVVATLPASYRPTQNVNFVFNASGGDLSGQNAQINTAGDIRLYPNRTVSYWSFSVMFFAGN